MSWPEIQNFPSALAYDSSTGSITLERVEATTIRANPKVFTITGASNTTPIVVTATSHGLLTGDAISISGITGNTNANGYFRITRLSANTFSLQNYSTGADIAGNGAYGGAPVAVTGIVQAGRVMAGDGTVAAPSIAFVSQPNYGLYSLSGQIVGTVLGVDVWGWTSSKHLKMVADTSLAWSTNTALSGVSDLFLSRPAAATLQLGAANSATPVGQRIRSQGAATGTDIAGADFSISPGPMTGTGATYAAGRYGTLRLGAYVQGATGTTTSTTAADRIVLPSRQVTLTGGSATNIVHINIPALAGASWDIAYSVQVTDSAAPVQMKVLGGRYYGSAYRLAAGNAVPNAVTETGDNEVHSVGGAATDVMTFTGDATGIMVAHNITVGTGLTAPNTILGTYIVTIGGTGAVSVTPQ